MPKKINYAAMYTLRADGRYQGYWRDKEGKRHTVCDRDPEKLYQKIQQAVAEKPLTFGDIAEAWEAAHWDKLRDGTKSCYAAPLRRAKELFGDRTASEVEAYEIANHLLKLRNQGLSAKSIKTQKTVYKIIYDHAICDQAMGREIRVNPAVGALLPSGMPRPVKREAPEDEIVAKIRAQARTAYFGLFALFLISTGFRRGEALAIRWEDIDEQAKTIRCDRSVSHRGGTAQIGETKTAYSVRVVPLLPDLAAVLHRPAGSKDTDYVFHGDDPSKPMPASTYDRHWLHYCKDMGFVTDEPETKTSVQGKKYVVHHYKPTLTAHNMRHGYATLLFEAGVDVYTAKDLLGHADIETTLAIYTHLRQRKKQTSIDILNTYVQDQIGRE